MPGTKFKKLDDIFVDYSKGGNTANEIRFGRRAAPCVGKLDGDNKPDNQKVVGRTGGVHTFEAKDFKKFKKDIEDVRKKGEGGDDPENDIEAIITAMLAYRDYGDIVLLADDSDMRDIKLLKRIRKPVHVIICGTKKGINAQYLQLAYRTKGSVHTANNDVDMRTIRDGQQIVLDKDVFEFRGGEFIWLDVND
jgi:hypothetical protein